MTGDQELAAAKPKGTSTTRTKARINTLPYRENKPVALPPKSRDPDHSPEDLLTSGVTSLDDLDGVEKMKEADSEVQEGSMIEALTGVERMQTNETAGPSFFGNLAGVEPMEDTVFPTNAAPGPDSGLRAKKRSSLSNVDAPPPASAKPAADEGLSLEPLPLVPPRTVISALDIAGVAALVVHRLQTVNARVVFANASLIEVAQTTLDGVMGLHPKALFADVTDDSLRALAEGEPCVFKLLSDNQTYTVTAVPADLDQTLLVLQPKPVEPSAEASDKAELFQLIGRLVAEEKSRPDSANVTIYARADEDMSLSVAASDIEAALTPLFRNAVEAAVTSRRREVDVEVTRSRDDILVTISDSGRGIDSEFEERIFLAGISTKTNQLGVGLSQARAAARRMGGDISATSTPLGAQFVLSLPTALLSDG